MTGRTVSLIHSPIQQARPHGPDCSYQGHARQPSEAPAILEARAQAMGALQLQTRRKAGLNSLTGLLHKTKTIHDRVEGVLGKLPVDCPATHLIQHRQRYTKMHKAV